MANMALYASTEVTARTLSQLSLNFSKKNGDGAGRRSEGDAHILTKYGSYHAVDLSNTRHCHWKSCRETRLSCSRPSPYAVY